MPKQQKQQKRAHKGNPPDLSYSIGATLLLLAALVLGLWLGLSLGTAARAEALPPGESPTTTCTAFTTLETENRLIVLNTVALVIIELNISSVQEEEIQCLLETENVKLWDTELQQMCKDHPSYDFDTALFMSGVEHFNKCGIVLYRKGQAV